MPSRETTAAAPSIPATISTGCIGTTVGPDESSWTSDDCLLYALAVGASNDHLAFTTENSDGVDQRVLPTFALVAGGPTNAIRAIDGIDWTRPVLHGEQRLDIMSPLRPSGTVTTTSSVTGLRTTRAGVAVTTTTRCLDSATGEEWFRTSGTAIVVNAVLDGPDVGVPLRLAALPDSAPQLVTTVQTDPRQALLYRLCGDRNPLHSDPAFARRAGFPRPILHGLCTLGALALALLDDVGGGRAEAMRSIACRFARPVTPGDAIELRVWRGPGGRSTFGVGGPNGDCVVDRGSFEFAP